MKYAGRLLFLGTLAVAWSLFTGAPVREGFVICLLLAILEDTMELRQRDGRQ